MSKRLEEIEARLDAITEGQWSLTRYSGGFSFGGSQRAYCGTDPRYGEPRTIPDCEADHIFIAHAPDDIRALLAVAKAARYVLYDHICKNNNLIANANIIELEVALDALEAGRE